MKADHGGPRMNLYSLSNEKPLKVVILIFKYKLINKPAPKGYFLPFED